MKFIATIMVTTALYSTVVIAQWSPGQPITDARDGQTYRTVVIGSQVWMAENLNIGTHITSSRFGSLMKDNGNIERYCYENAVANCDGTGGAMKRGGMYEWEEAVQHWSGPMSLPLRGICPEGWHVSSYNEWRLLTQYLGTATAYTALIEGGSSGFDAFFTGYRDEMGGDFAPAVGSDQYRAYFWTADAASGERSQVVEIGPDDMRVLPLTRANGFCVRCVYDGPSTGIEEAVQPTDFQLLKLIVRPGRSVLMHFVANAGNVNIVITDLLGRIVHNSGIQALQGENYHQIELSGVAAGSYVLRMQSRSGLAMRVVRIY